MKSLLWGLLLMSNLVSASEVTVHYNRLGGYEGWNLWVWNEEEHKAGSSVALSEQDGYGAVFKFDTDKLGISGRRTGILPRKGEWEAKDSPDRFITPEKDMNIYIMEGDQEIYAEPPVISTKTTGAWLDLDNSVRVTFNRPVTKEYVEGLQFVLQTTYKEYSAPEIIWPAGAPYSRYASLKYDMPQPSYKDVNENQLRVSSRYMPRQYVSLGTAMYNGALYSEQKLGAYTEEGKTVVRIFAPKALKAYVLVYKAPDMKDIPGEYRMQYTTRGLFEKKFDENLDGRYYRIKTEQQDGKIFTGLDPYAECVTNDRGSALIGKDTATVSAGPVFPLEDTIIYEVSLRDLTVDPNSGVPENIRGKYLGAAMSGTTDPLYKDIKTGIDHIAELGVNTVHIMPFQDYENDDDFSKYNWGYMPVNFNSPEGAYATDPRNGSRVKEAKAMIDAFHKKGIKVVMDVVYNHTAETRSNIYNFNAMSMDYYYRVNPDGTYSNGSGCGNEFNTEAPMARRFLIDSLTHWVRDYNVDGFRFDLMGLIDTGAVDAVTTALRKIKPDIIVYGEPWTGGATPTKGVTKGAQRGKGYAVFGDNFRDAIKGSVFKAEEKGYVQAGINRPKIIKGIKGSIDDFASSPLEAINYVSCHDNNTLWDRISISAKDASEAEKIKMDKLANAIVLTSQGIPFIHAGAEFLRTKNGEDNSYNLPDSVNELDWNRKHQYIDVFNYYKDLIAFRKTHKALRMTSADEIRQNLKMYEDLGFNMKNGTIAYMIEAKAAGDISSRLIVLINPARIPQKFQLPAGDWRLAFSEKGLPSKEESSEIYDREYEVPAISLAVLSEDRDE